MIMCNSLYLIYNTADPHNAFFIAAMEVDQKQNLPVTTLCVPPQLEQAAFRTHPMPINHLATPVTIRTRIVSTRTHITSKLLRILYTASYINMLVKQSMKDVPQFLQYNYPATSSYVKPTIANYDSRGHVLLIMAKTNKVSLIIEE